MTYHPEPTAYQLRGVVEDKDDDGKWYSNREYVLSFEEDDAGDIEMRISDAEALFSVEQVLMIAQDCEDIQDLIDVMTDEVRAD